MAASAMKFITIVGHAGLRGEILAALQRLGVVQFTDVDDSLDAAENRGGGDRLESSASG